MKRIFSLITVLLLSTSLFAQEKSDKDVVVAQVFGKKIMKSELIEYHTKNLNYVRARKPVTIKRSLNDLVNRLVGIQNAKKENLQDNAIVRAKMEDVLYHAKISKDLEPQLKKIVVSDDDVKKYYAKNPEYHTAQILLRLRSTPSAKEVDENLKKASAIYKDLQKNPGSFSELALKFSQAANHTTGGDLGFQPKTRLTPEYYASIKSRPVGYITKPFRTQYGIHIAKVLGVKKYANIDTKMYKKIIYDTKRDKILEKYFQEQREKAKVKIYENNL